MTKINFEMRAMSSGCLVSISHKLNKDGYLRLRCNNKLMMFHRFIWEQANGPIPEGYEIDHMCKNRACFNLEHLQMLDGTTHTAEGNAQRYLGRMVDAERYWREHKCTGVVLSEIFKVSFGTACRWIRKWNTAPVVNHKGCGSCYFWDVEDHDCYCPSVCDDFSAWINKRVGEKP